MVLLSTTKSNMVIDKKTVGKKSTNGVIWTQGRVLPTTAF